MPNVPLLLLRRALPFLLHHHGDVVGLGMLGNMKSRLAHVATVGEARCLRPQLAHLPGGGGQRQLWREEDVT